VSDDLYNMSQATLDINEDVPVHVSANLLPPESLAHRSLYCFIELKLTVGTSSQTTQLSGSTSLLVG